MVISSSLSVNPPALSLIHICGDDGAPAATKVDSITGQAFLSLAQSVVTVVNRRNAEKAPTKIVSKMCIRDRYEGEGGSSLSS